MEPRLTLNSQFFFSPPGAGIIGVCPMLTLNSFKEWILFIRIFMSFMFKCVVMKLMVQNIKISNRVCQKKRFIHR